MLTYHLYWKIRFYWYEKDRNLCNGSLPIVAGSACYADNCMLPFPSGLKVDWIQKMGNLGYFIDASTQCYPQIKLFGCVKTSWHWNLWTPHASKQLEKVSWFHTNDQWIIAWFIFTSAHLPDANTIILMTREQVIN